MQNVPKPIQDTLQQLKTKENTRLELRKIKNHYYYSDSAKTLEFKYLMLCSMTSESLHYE